MNRNEASGLGGWGDGKCWLLPHVTFFMGCYLHFVLVCFCFPSVHIGSVKDWFQSNCPCTKTKNPPPKKRHHVTNKKQSNLPLSQPPKENIWDLQSKKTYPAEKSWIVKSWARYQRKMQIDLLQSAVDLWPFRGKHGDLLPLKRWRCGKRPNWEGGSLWDPPRFGWWSLGGGMGWEW